jgi:formamidopyrimidine-DNA glycosylase
VPELPDITLYTEAIAARALGHALVGVRITSPFLLRTFDPPIEATENRVLVGVSRLGKRVVLALEAELFIVIHLMIAGRFRWLEPGTKMPARITLTSLRFDSGTLVITEAGTKRRASMHLLQGHASLASHAVVGLDVLAATPDDFAHAIRRENHTLKRTLTDPRIIDGIGNAYSDEILHAARLSPVQLSQNLSDDECARLHAAARETLTRWTDRLRRDFKDRFPGPGDITAFRPDFAVHGRYRMPCPVCSTPVQRIRYAENETNYCPTCQTGGRVLADRSLSRLLKGDWPRTVEELA